MYQIKFHERIKANAVYRLQISALVPEIFKFEKCEKYANEITDDVIHSPKYSGTSPYGHLSNTDIGLSKTDSSLGPGKTPTHSL